MLASVRHENVVQMYGAIVEPPLFIIVMGEIDSRLGSHEPTGRFWVTD